MAGVLANPTFVTGAKDDLAAADVYKQSSSAPINKIKDSSLSLTSSPTSATSLLGGKNMLNTLKGVLAGAQAAKILTKSGGDPLLRLTAAAGPLATALKTLPNGGGIAGSILGNVRGVTGAIASVGMLTQVMKKGTDLTKIATVGSLINAVSNSSNFKLSDPRALVGACSGVIRTAISSGIGGSFNQVVTGLTGNKMLGQVCGSVLPAVVRGGDLKSLSQMVNAIPPGSLRALSPSIVPDFAKNFSYSMVPRSPATFGEVKQVFTTIQPDWMSTTRGGQSVINLSCVQTASPDFRNLMSLGIMSDPAATTQERLLMMGPMFPQRSVVEQLQNQYPATTVFRPAPVLPVDPRSLANPSITIRDLITN